MEPQEPSEPVMQTQNVPPTVPDSLWHRPALGQGAEGIAPWVLRSPLGSQDAIA